MKNKVCPVCKGRKFIIVFEHGDLKGRRITCPRCKGKKRNL